MGIALTLEKIIIKWVLLGLITPRQSVTAFTRLTGEAINPYTTLSRRLSYENKRKKTV